MVSDDVVYVTAITLSVAAGPLFREVLKDSHSKRWVSTILGVILLLVTCGYHFIHLCITVIGNCILLSLVPASKNDR